MSSIAIYIPHATYGCWPCFLLFLKVHDQLQTNGISKGFDALRQDCAQIEDFLLTIKMFINFVYLSEQEIEISRFKDAAKYISYIVFLSLISYSFAFFFSPEEG